MIRYLFIILLALNGLSVLQASALVDKNSKELNGSGSIRGGVAGPYMSLLDVRRSSDKKLKIERLVFDWGDKLLNKTASGGYYQLEYREKLNQLIISFALTLNTKFENSLLKEKLNNGLYIQNSNMEFDSATQSIITTIQLKKNVKIKVIDLKPHGTKSTAKLIIDLIGDLK